MSFYNIMPLHDLTCSQSVKPFVQLAFEEIDEIHTLEDLADFIASFLFTTMESCSTLEQQFLIVKRLPSSIEVYQFFVNLVKQYGYMCHRHKRDSILGVYQLSEVFVKMVPLTVENRLRMLHDIYI